eukprot:2955725-Amphidinium_carterae.1
MEANTLRTHRTLGRRPAAAPFIGCLSAWLLQRALLRWRYRRLTSGVADAGLLSLCECLLGGGGDFGLLSLCEFRLGGGPGGGIGDGLRLELAVCVCVCVCLLGGGPDGGFGLGGAALCGPSLASAVYPCGELEL